jgi:hypothetical protein
MTSDAKSSSVILSFPYNTRMCNDSANSIAVAESSYEGLSWLLSSIMEGDHEQEL